MLLATVSPSTSQNTDKSNAMDEYLRKISGQEKEPDIIMIDHNYAKFWFSHADSHHAKPARMLFMKGLLQRSDAALENNPVVDIETMKEPVVPVYDNAKTRALITECDQFLSTSLPNGSDEEKEPSDRANWSIAQKTLHKNAMKILNSNRLSRLAFTDNSIELVRRRIIIDKGASRMRQLFASNTWDMKLLSWLHCVLVDNLSTLLLTEYFEIIRTLKAKVPSLIDKLLVQCGAFHSGLFSSSSAEAFNQLIRKTWDPVAGFVNQNKMKKLPGNPLIIVIPGTPNQPPAHLSQRVRFWNSHLGSLGKVTQLPVHTSPTIAVDECLHQLFTMARNKVVEMRSQSSKRPIVLLGWTIGALVACHVAVEEPVSAVICLGFPLKGVNGSRGDLDDPLLDSKIPTLFVIGQNSTTCSMDDIEDFRERMRAETGLVVVGGADDTLRVSVTKKKIDGVTQSMVDKCIVDEIEDFLGVILNQKYSAPSTNQSVASKKVVAPPIPTVVIQDDSKRQRKRPREYSPELSIRKKSRPVGRPSNHQKPVPSSSSSDTSSVGSGADETSALRKDKRSLSRKSAKTSQGMLKKRNSRSVSELPQPAPEVLPKEKDPKPDAAKEIGSCSSVTAISLPSSTAAKLNPAKILAEQQKNGPVDVEKAFGKDSSFLPRPLTPAEFDPNELLTITSPSKICGRPLENLNAALEAIAAEDSVLTSQLTLLSPTKSTVTNLSLSPGKQKISFLKSTDNIPITSFSSAVNSTIAISKPQVVSKIAESIFDFNKSHLTAVQKIQPSDLIAVATSSKGIVTSPQAKFLSGSALSMKHVKGIMSSLAGKTLLTSPSISPSKSQTQILVSSSPNALNKSATFLLSSNESSNLSKIQFRKMVVQSGSSKLPLLSQITSTKGIMDDGMKEPIKQAAREAQSNANATLVKLTSPSDSGMKRLRLIEAMPSSTSPMRFETPEELAEKQMAIRALSNSLGEEIDSPSGGYSTPTITKPDSHFSMLGYSIVAPKSSQPVGLRPPYRRARGRGFSGFPNVRKTRGRRIFQF